MSCSHQRPVQRLVIEEEFTVRNAAAEKSRLVAAVRAPGTITELDLSGVQEMDSAGVQLLLLCVRIAEFAGGSLRLTAPSAPVRDVIELLRLQGVFADAAEQCPQCTSSPATAAGTGVAS
jgi:anti-sigma B factor antagonist